MTLTRRLALTPLAALLIGSACAPAAVTSRADVPSVADPWDAVGLIAELNDARRDPRAYARRVRDFRALFTGDRFQRPGEIPVVTQEGVAAVDEAIRFLESQPSLPPLARSAALDRAAADHAADQGRTGQVGHAGADGSAPHQRMRRHGSWRATGETIAYGPVPAHAVMQLIVDDGVPDRGHRDIIFSPAYEMVGAACGPHPRWRTVCVVTFATPMAPPPAG
ncbi:MAG TPA: CAP domain-containing protein [Brevundimonas sp.]|jgi:uncharacterized protein YkwD|uniref:CAP domain-containing protein n=1 Tax=Brevundimonas sp. TaxID=1871086 RepID=UPI002DEB3A66|nr:CAP domain-containing protein [Brevundimonas sp.]